MGANVKTIGQRLTDNGIKWKGKIGLEGDYLIGCAPKGGEICRWRRKILDGGFILYWVVVVKRVGL